MLTFTSQTQDPLSPHWSPQSAEFTVQRKVRFSDCDPAGMVFYPQYFVMLNALIEDWFTQALNVNYAQLLGDRRIGLPMVSLKCNFRSPSRMGETIALQLRLGRMGSRSITLSVQCSGTGNRATPRWSAEAVIVTTSLDHDGAIAIPPDIVQGIQHWQKLSGDFQ